MPKLTVNDTKKKLQEAMRASKDADNFVEIYTDKTYDVADEAVKAGYVSGFLGLHDTMLTSVNFDNDDNIELLSDPKAFAKSLEEAYAATLNFEGAVNNLRTEMVIRDDKVGADFYDDDLGIKIAHSNLFEDNLLMSPANTFVYDTLRTGVKELSNERTIQKIRDAKSVDDEIEIYTEGHYEVTGQAVDVGYDEGFVGLHNTMLTGISYNNDESIGILTDPVKFAKYIEDAYAASINFENAVDNLRTEMVVRDGVVGADFYDDDRGIKIAHSDIDKTSFLRSPRDSMVYDILRQGATELMDGYEASRPKLPVDEYISTMDPSIDASKVKAFAKTIIGGGNIDSLTGAGIIDVQTDQPGKSRLSRFDLSGEIFENLDMDPDPDKKIFLSQVGDSMRITYSGFEKVANADMERAIHNAVGEALYNNYYMISELKGASGLDVVKAFSVQRENRNLTDLIGSSDKENATLDESLVSEKENSFDKGLGE